jgi:hypothetical protein
VAEPIIRAVELKPYPQAAIRPFVEWGILTEAGAPEGVTCYHPCHKCDEDLILQRDGKAFTALCPLNEWPATPMTADEVGVFKVSVDQLGRTLQRQNRFQGRFEQFDERLYSLGSQVVGPKRLAFVLFVRADQEAKSVLLSLKDRLPGAPDRAIVFTPTASIQDVDMLRQLENAGVIAAPIETNLKRPTTLELDYGWAVAEETASGERVRCPQLTPKQQKDYSKHGYQRFDRLVFTGKIPKRRSNEVLVNGVAVTISNSLMLPLLRYVQELKKRRGGWLPHQILRDEEIMPDDEAAPARTISQLNGALKPGLLDKERPLFETGGEGAYRLSVHPDFIECAKGPNWLTEKFNGLRDAVDEERQRRKQRDRRRVR